MAKQNHTSSSAATTNTPMSSFSFLTRTRAPTNSIPRQRRNSCRADVHRPRRTGLGQTHLPVSGYSESGLESLGLSMTARSLLRLIRPHRPQASQSIASKWKCWCAPNRSTALDCGVPSSASHSCNIRFTSFRGRTVTGGKPLATLGGTVTWMKNAPPSKQPLLTCGCCSRSPGPHSRWTEG